MSSPYREASPSDANPLLTASHSSYNTSNSEEVYSSYGLVDRFRRSTTAVIFVTSMILFTDMMVYGVVLPILPIVVHERLGLDAKSVGFLFGCYAIGLLSATPIFGVVSDRYRTRRIPMLFGMVTLAICSILFGIATTYWQLVIARIAQGAAGGGSWTLSLAMLADRFGSGPKLSVAMGTVLSANTLGIVAGPLIGGLLYQYWGYTSPFIFCGILAIICFLVISMIIEPSMSYQDSIIENDLEDNPEDNRNEVSTESSFWDLITDWNIINVCLAIIIVAIVLTGLEPVLPLHLYKLGANASQIGLLFIAIAVPSFFSPLVGYMSFYIGQRKTCGIGMILLGIAAPLISIPNKLWLIALPLLLFGTAYAIVITPTLPLLGHYVSGGAYGQVYALWNMSYSIGMFVGPVIGGVLFELLGFQYTLITFSAIAIAITPLLICKNDRRYEQYVEVNSDVN